MVMVDWRVSRDMVPDRVVRLWNKYGIGWKRSSVLCSDLYSSEKITYWIVSLRLLT